MARKPPQPVYILEGESTIHRTRESALLALIMSFEKHLASLRSRTLHERIVSAQLFPSTLSWIIRFYDQSEVKTSAIIYVPTGEDHVE